MPDTPVIPIITGATASGKSALLLRAADLGLNFEIVSADAFQVYKGLDIGTAKPNIYIRGRINHHLIDIVPTDGEYNAGDFVCQAEKTIGDILSKGVLPIISGGTGLYIQSLRDGIFEVPAADPQIRAALQERAEKEGSEVLYTEFQRIDPAAAAQIHKNDLVRIIRGLEVWFSTGMPISQARKKLQKQPKYKYDIMVIDKNRDILYEDIDRRVHDMLANGWLKEVHGLLSAGFSPKLPSFRAIGYGQLADVVLGNTNITSAAEVIARKTRNYAKRQFTWFRGMHDVKFMSEDEILNTMVDIYG